MPRKSTNSNNNSGNSGNGVDTPTNSNSNSDSDSNSNSNSNSDVNKDKTTNESVLSKLTLVADKRGAPVTLEHYAAVFLWLGWISSYFLLLALLIFLYFKSIKAFTVYLAVIVYVTFVPINKKTQPKWGFQIASWIMHKAQEYFGVRLYFEDKNLVSNPSPAIFFLEPHDVLPVGIFVFQDYLNYFPGHKM